MSRSTSCTVRASRSSPITSRVTVTIAARDAGTATVSLGRNWMIAMVSATRPSMIHSGSPLSQSLPPPAPGIWNC